jgi:NurA-like 5'-3' nuclease
MYLVDLDPASVSALKRLLNRPEYKELIQWLVQSQNELDKLLRNLEGNALLQAQGAAKMLEVQLDILTEATPEKDIAIKQEEKED